MATLIKNLRNDRKVVFDSGRFDTWCVYVVELYGSRNSPRDNQYFADLQSMAQKYSDNKVYDDFVRIYDSTTASIKDDNVLSLIDEIVVTYNDEDKIIIEQWFSVIYGGMIAEENKEFTKLGKRVKRLGMYQVLIENMNPNVAANFSKGKTWQELDALMKGYGF
ncbi:MAG: hypothetical protein LBG77_07370 [Dysgonamonadaceae bacterium]|jgi:hypothetical protein|nr:hypothetical protein [Dysgonamonadaceae bacterium]